MKQSGERAPRRRRIVRTVAWGLSAILVAAIAVEISRTGIDIFVLVVLAAVIVLLERTVGDWMSELMGSALSTLALAACLGLGAWSAFSQGGAADRFFTAAESRGYHALYYRSAPTPRNDSPSPQAQPVVVESSAPSRVDVGALRPKSVSPALAGTSGSTVAEPAPPETEKESPVASSSFPTIAAVLQRDRPAPTLIVMDVPSIAVTGKEVRIRFRLTSDGKNVPGAAVAISIGGQSAGVESTRADGSATVSFLPRVPGMYDIQVRFEGTRLLVSSSAAATVTVLPGRQ